MRITKYLWQKHGITNKQYARREASDPRTGRRKLQMFVCQQVYTWNSNVYAASSSESTDNSKQCATYWSGIESSRNFKKMSKECHVINNVFTWLQETD